ncbi:ABC transporter ATP-binding protein [Marinivivus vitaminiproducens]|uniref:ABC transporter ATP-binding protein n=1 Tax=Marinivivus vitaminiproducens TaxID=3035935 RepID=UPI00279A4016|nr:sn-glycerol-3-phosphate ABC transporter ATP-binding protein UgpC [Geminicoccaceae bacterium SCSIO 64248]
MSSVALEHVVKRFGDVQVIHGVDLAIEPGEFVVFVGPSGCGKSTLLRMIAGLESITEGGLRIDGKRMNEVPPARRGIAMVFQSYALYPHMSVYKNLAFGLQTAGMPKAEIDTRVRKAAGILQIEPLLDRRPKQLSGGQRQRVAIGRAIVREPGLFLFDEPLSNLDAELRVQMRVEIAKLHKDLAATMIYVTHDQVEAMTMADKIVVLRQGRIEQVGTPLDLYNHPANRFVAGFIGSPKMNFLDAAAERLGDNQLRVAVGSSSVTVAGSVAGSGEHVTFGVRPEHLSLDGGISLGPTRVQLIEQLGGSTLIYATLEDGQPLTMQLDGQRRIEPGEVVHAMIDPDQCHLFGDDGLALRAQPQAA